MQWIINGQGSKVTLALFILLVDFMATSSFLPVELELYLIIFMKILRISKKF